jgi:ABC-2 type transport system ATP-binding protein
MLAGLIVPDRGEVRIAGAAVRSGGRAVRSAIGYMPQQYSLYGDLSVAENLRFFGMLFGLDDSARVEREQRLLSITRLERFRDRRADALSGGMYKKLALACALLHTPRVLLLDEPTNGVDPVSRRDLWELLHEFTREGMAVLISTPYMDEAARCHRVGLMHAGAVIAEGEPQALVRSFPHAALLVRPGNRDALEALALSRPEVLAAWPHGDELRVVVRQGAAEDFRQWLGSADPAATAEPVRPDFEDVFLGLTADEVRGQSHD